MSETPAPRIVTFVAAWKNAFVKVLTQLGAPNATISDVAESALQPASEKNTNVISANFAGGGCMKGQLLVTCEKPAAVQCAQLLASEPTDAAAEFTSTHSDGSLEFLRQVAGETASAWKTERELPAELVFQGEPPAAVEAQFTAFFNVDTEKCKGLIFRLDLDAGFCAALSAPPQEQAQDENAANPEVDSAASHASNLDLILDVQLEATIRFGEREMLLQDVFGLTPGAVVELDQLVNEPAELLVAGRLVAKGEVVVVDGNFGLRVTEVVSRSQRAEMLSLE
jgi:flagellar motor switch protein FliN